MSDTDLFDRPAQWRADVIELMHELPPDRWAAASCAPAFPQLLAFMLRAVDAAPPGAVLDVGCGLGGIADAVRHHTRRLVIASEPMAGSIEGTARLFPELTTVRAEGDRLPFRDSSVTAVTLVGVMSLVAQPDRLLGEIERVAATGCRLVIVDLVADGRSDRNVESNCFRTLASIESLFGDSLVVIDRAAAEPEVGTWSESAGPVTSHIERARGGEEDFEVWKADQDHLAGEVDAGHVLVGAMSGIVHS